MTSRVDQIMEQASRALARMDYLRCEALCVEALASARRQRLWADYARILMPLQESRRQRRMIAAEGTIRLGSATLTGRPADWLERINAGCLVLTHPHGAEEARELQALTRRQRRYVEVLLADNAADAATWTIRSFIGPDVSCRVDAPPRRWLDTTLEPAGLTKKGAAPGGSADDKVRTLTSNMNLTRQPADWFLDACEALGDAALARIEPNLEPVRRIEALEQCLGVIYDHEILHQRLGDTARQASISK